MSNKYPPYGSRGKCEKCGAQGTWDNFHDGKSPCVSMKSNGICNVNFAGPHLHRKCENCKFEWAEAPIKKEYEKHGPSVVWFHRNKIDLLEKENVTGDYESLILLLKVGTNRHLGEYVLGYYYFSQTNPGWRLLPEDEKVVINNYVLGWTFLPEYCEPTE